MLYKMTNIMKKSKLSQEKVNQILELWDSKKQIGEIQKSVGTSYYEVKNVVQTHRVYYRRTTATEYDNPNFFKKIDTEEKAYWLGYMYADGCVRNKKDRVGEYALSLSSIDFIHLCKFRDCINKSQKIYVETQKKFNKKINKVVFAGKELMNDIIDKGCFPAKSLILKFPTEEQVPNDLLHHFIRGYFDGDGCASITHENKRNYYRMMSSIIGTKDFLKELAKYIPNKGLDFKLAERLPIKLKPLRGHSITHVLTYDTIESVILYEYLYKDATVFLERKKEKFDLFFSSKDLQRL